MILGSAWRVVTARRVGYTLRCATLQYRSLCKGELHRFPALVRERAAARAHRKTAIKHSVRHRPTTLCHRSSMIVRVLTSTSSALCLPKPCRVTTPSLRQSDPISQLGSLLLSTNAETILTCLVFHF